MSYRNDHDAALHRVDALEDELERLRKAYDTERSRTKPEPRKRKRRVAPAVAIGFALLGASAAVHAIRSEPVPAARVEVPRAVEARLDWMRTCANAIEKLHVRLDATTTDPRRGTPEPVSQVVPTSAPCRDSIAGWVRSTGERGSPIGAWTAAEDQLAGAISRILVYYGADPYTLDNYATATQLWREYDAAIDARDRVLELARSYL